jgi:hypothetical protein
MQVTDGISKPDRRSASACVACRLSKVKCDLPETGVCSRCARLGLSCVVSTSRRGQPNVKRDVARLGPAVRAMLTQGSETTTLTPDMEMSLAAVPDDKSLCWSGSKCQRMVVESIDNDEGKLALLKHWLLIGMRSQNCGLLGNVLMLAHSYGFADLNLFQKQLTEPASPQWLLPPYLREWFDEPQRACNLRLQHEGGLRFEANQPFCHLVADPTTLEGQLLEEVPDLLSKIDWQICKAEIFLASALHPDDRMNLMMLVATLWAQVAIAPVDASGVRRTQAAAPSTVRCSVICTDATTREYVPCRLEGRCEMHRDSQLVGTIFSISAVGVPCPFSAHRPVGLHPHRFSGTAPTLRLDLGCISSMRPMISSPPREPDAHEGVDLSQMMLETDLQDLGLILTESGSLEVEGLGGLMLHDHERGSMSCCAHGNCAIHDAEAVVHDHVHAHSRGHDHGLP